MELFELGLSTTELWHRLIIVHLLDLVVLELLLIELFLTLLGKFINLLELPSGSFRTNHTCCSRVVINFWGNDRLINHGSVDIIIESRSPFGTVSFFLLWFVKDPELWLIEVGVPALGKLLCVTYGSLSSFFLWWIVIEDLLRLFLCLD